MDIGHPGHIAINRIEGNIGGGGPEGGPVSFFDSDIYVDDLHIVSSANTNSGYLGSLITPISANNTPYGTVQGKLDKGDNGEGKVQLSMGFEGSSTTKNGVTLKSRTFNMSVTGTVNQIEQLGDDAASIFAEFVKSVFSTSVSVVEAAGSVPLGTQAALSLVSYNM